MAGRRFTDTTNFAAIDVGDEIAIGEHVYRVTGNEREQRFTMEDPKLWVKRAVDLSTDESVIVKLTYFESFQTTVAGIRFFCFRNPTKEGQILDLARGHPGFMQGRAFTDTAGNNIRILKRVRGPNLFNQVGNLAMDHEQYFMETLPGVLARLVKAFEAIRFLHAAGFRHGDIRSDHIIVEAGTGAHVWIDFDYDWEASENPYGLDVFGLGNVLLYVVGRGYHSAHDIVTDTDTYGDLIDRLSETDFSLLTKWRLANLKKLYPYLPDTLNDVLLHFSLGAEMPYETVDEIIEDLYRCLNRCFG